MSRQGKKTRSAVQKTLYALEHHASPLKEVVAILTMYLAASPWEPDSSRGGPNSWHITGPQGQRLEFRLRWNPIRLEVSDGTVLTPSSRNKTIGWCEKVLV